MKLSMKVKRLKFVGMRQLVDKVEEMVKSLTRPVDKALDIIRDKADPNARISARRGVGTLICLWALSYMERKGAIEWEALVVLGLGVALIALSSVNFNKNLQVRGMPTNDAQSS